MRWILVLTIPLAACSKGPAADLPSIGEARSLGAEWALVNEQAAQDHLTPTYVETMRKQLRRQLQSGLASMLFSTACRTGSGMPSTNTRIPPR